MKRLLFLALSFSILLSGCMSTLNIRALKPSDVMLPENVQKIAVVNRFIPGSKSNQTLNIIEGIATGEGIFTDREGAENAVNGLLQQLKQSPRYEVVQPAAELKGNGLGVFPPLLPAEEVRAICDKVGAQALATLEAFDSDNIYHDEIENRKSTTKEGVAIVTIIHHAKLDTRVTIGFRIYDAKTNSLYDEFKGEQRMGWDKEGPTVEAARALLPPNRQAIKDVGFIAGTQYAIRIAPSWINIARQYYPKGNDDMKNAAIRMRAGKWDAAAEIYKLLTVANDKKIAGKAAYNMAVIAEAQGKLDIALDWATKSASEFKNKKAARYIDILRYRKAEQERVDRQMKDKK